MPTFVTPGPIDATVDVGFGHVHLRAGDRTDTVVDVRPTDPAASIDVEAADRSRVEYSNGQLTVTVPNKKTQLRTLFGRPGQVDVTVDLPAGSRVDVDVRATVRSEGRLGESWISTAVGSVRLGETGRLKLRTAAGDVSVVRVGGSADVNTSSGKIRLGDVDGAVTAKTAHGDIALGSVTGDMRLRTAAGDIAVDRAHDSVEAKTAYGSIRIGEVVRGTVQVETAFGEIEVGVREGTAAWLDVSSGMGSVRSELGSADRPEPADQTVEVRGRTGWGDIVIRRATPAPDETQAPEDTPAPDAATS